MIPAKMYSQQRANTHCLNRAKTDCSLQKSLLFLLISLFALTNFSSAQYEWTKQNTGVTVGYLNCVLWAHNQFVAVSTDSGAIFTSPDGITWTRHNVNAELYSIAWTGDKYVAVGDTVVLSLDGLTWTYGNLPSLKWPHCMTSVIWDGKQLVGAGAFVFRSFDGITWDVVFTSPICATVYDLVWAGNKYVPLWDGLICTSPDLITWEVVPGQNTPLNLHHGTWDGKRIVGIAESKILESKDGYQWTQIDTLPWSKTNDNYRSTGGSLRYFSNCNTYIFCRDWRRIYISHNGEPWKKINFDESVGFMDVAFSGDLFVAVGVTGAIYTSPLVTSVQHQQPEKNKSNTIISRCTGNNLNLILPYRFINQTVTVEIHAVSGRRILSRKLYANTLTHVFMLDNVHSGRYVVSVKSKNLTLSKPLSLIK